MVKISSILRNSQFENSISGCGSVPKPKPENTTSTTQIFPTLVSHYTGYEELGMTIMHGHGVKGQQITMPE